MTTAAARPKESESVSARKARRDSERVELADMSAHALDGLKGRLITAPVAFCREDQVTQIFGAMGRMKKHLEKEDAMLHDRLDSLERQLLVMQSENRLLKSMVGGTFGPEDKRDGERLAAMVERALEAMQIISAAADGLRTTLEDLKR